LLRRVVALMMEAASISETSVNFYQITRRNNPEDSHLRSFYFHGLYRAIPSMDEKINRFTSYEEEFTPNTILIS
jgi:hypothetical protein